MRRDSEMGCATTEYGDIIHTMNASDLVAGQTLVAVDGRKVRGGDMEVGAVEVVSTEASVYGPHGYLRIIPAKSTRSSRFISRDAQVRVT